MYLGIDVGGTTARVAVFRDVNDTEPVHETWFTVTQPSRDAGPAELQSCFAKDSQHLRDTCRGYVRRYGQIDGAGLAVAGKIDPDRTMVTGSGNLPHWEGMYVRRMLVQELDCYVCLGNDAEAAALAEAHYGDGQHHDFWFVIWGTGVGGCLVRHINGKPRAFAGELGHQKVRYGSAQMCGCKQSGCLEAYCGGKNIHLRHHCLPQNLSEDQWAEVLGWMQIGLQNVVTAQPVDRVFFGGGIASKQRHRLPVLQDNLSKELKIVEPPSIDLSRFGESAGTIGALALLKNVN